jgi:hypothetical protein
MPGEVVVITGWAVDPFADGPGISAVEIYLGAPEDGGIYLGEASYGIPRPDVASALGRPDWIEIGYELAWFVGELPPGDHAIVVVAYVDDAESWGYGSTVVSVPFAGLPVPVAPPPGPPQVQPVPLPTPPPAGPPPGPIPGPGPGSSPPILPPPGAQLIVLTNADPSGAVHLAWLPLETARSYRIYISPTGAPTGFTILSTVNQGIGSVTSTTAIEQLVPGAPYVFQVRAVSPTGEEIPVPASAGLGVGFNPTVVGTASSLGNVRLYWPPVPRATSYRVYRSASGAPGSFMVATTVNQNPGTITLAATISGLVPGETYQFQVRAIDSSGRETPVPGASLFGLDPFFPPANLTIGGLGATQISLNWAPSPTPRVTAHRVYVAPAGSTAFSAATLTNVTQTSATVIGLVPNTSYSFHVVAIDIDGRESPPSNTVTARTQF